MRISEESRFPEGEVLVSVCCLCYNHEAHLEKALQGFVAQITDFRYEVIVHDDASTDRSPQILRRYAERYPELFVPVLQTENQYSKGGGVAARFVYPKVRGKYVALCEGDDYWQDPHKLQKQVEFLETHPDYAACAHNTRMVDMRTGEERLMYPDTEADVALEQLMLGGGRGYHTSSLMMRSELLRNRPADLGAGDFALAIYLRLNGKIRRLQGVMSTYQYYTKGSWSQRVSSSYRKRLGVNREAIRMLQAADRYSEGKYHRKFSLGIAKRRLKAVYYRIRCIGEKRK